MKKKKRFAIAKHTMITKSVYFMVDLDFFILQFNAFFNVQSLLLISGMLNFNET